MSRNAITLTVQDREQFNSNNGMRMLVLAWLS
jgi:hypothetical protein